MLHPKEGVANQFKQEQTKRRMLFIRIKAPESAHARNARFRQFLHHLVNIARWIEGISINKEMVFALRIL